MVSPDRDLLSGDVEVDEVMIGGVDVGISGIAGTKVPVMVAVERSGEGRRLGRMRAQITSAPNTLHLVTLAAAVVEPGQRSTPTVR